MRLLWAYELIFLDFGNQLGSKMEASWGFENALLLSLTEKGENPKSIYFPKEFEYFLDSGGPKLEQKSIKNR